MQPIADHAAYTTSILLVVAISQRDGCRRPPRVSAEALTPLLMALHVGFAEPSIMTCMAHAYVSAAVERAQWERAVSCIWQVRTQLNQVSQVC